MGDEILKDSRFAHLLNDPRYKYVPKSERKVKIDKRFQSMFKDKNFKVSYTIDKRGRPISKTSTEDLKRYYDLTSSSEEDTDEEDGKEVRSDEEVPQKAGSFVRAPQPEDDDSEQCSADETTHINNVNDKLERGDIGKQIKKRLKDLTVDYARGEANIASDSSSDEESSSEDENKLVLEHCWGELDRDAERTEESTFRLAACNMDWDRMRATDIMVLCNSFLPKGGIIHSVTIYPSEFGLQRMAEEDVKGPVELTSTSVENNSDEENNDNEEGSEFHMEKLRQYQLNRLKYYYAVIVFDSKETAEKLYNECDGLEYESSATKLDLRFIPDDVTFDEKPHDVCTELPDLSKYEPRQFTTTALQQAKVELTWDETCPQRKEITKKLMSGKVDDVTDTDLKDYLASSSGEDNDENDDNDDNLLYQNDGKDNGKLSSLDKYKALLQDIRNKEEAKKNKDVEMEVSWGLGLKDKSEKLVKDKLNKREDMTPFEKMIDKIKEKKNAKREERKKKQKEDADTNSDSSDDIPDGIDMNDPYFQEEFQNSEFQGKKLKKKKEKVKKNEDDSDSDKKKKELELLLMDEDDQEKSHFSLKKIQDAENDTKSKSKRRKKLLKRKADDASINNDIPDFEIDVNDERFSALYTSHHYNIDPTNSHYKKTKGMESLINAKLAKRASSDNHEEVSKNEIPSKKSNSNVAMNMMVKNIKRNARMITNK